MIYARSVGNVEEFHFQLIKNSSMREKLLFTLQHEVGFLNVERIERRTVESFFSTLGSFE